MKRTSRKPKRTSRNPRRGSKVEFVVDLSHAPHIEDVKFTDATGARAILFRGLSPLVEFKPTDSQVKKILSGKGKLQITEGQIVARSRWPHVGKLESNGYGRSYSNDPRWMAAKYPGVDSEGKSFRKGDEILYWPSTKTAMTGATAKDAWRRFLSEKGDDEGSPFASNPRRKRTSRNPKAPSVAEVAPWRVRDRLTRHRYYFDSRAEAESFIESVSTSEVTGEPLRQWADRLVAEKNV